MKIKNIVAIALVFATLFGFCACGKVKSSGEVETETSEVLYVEGEDGESYSLKAATDSDTGETEYFYYDSESKRVVVEAETDEAGTTRFYETDAKGSKVEITTKVETVTVTKATTAKSSGKSSKTTTSSADAEEFIEGLTGSLEDYTDAPTTAVKFVMGSDLVDLASTATEVVELDTDGNPVLDTESYFTDLATKDKYTVKAVNRTESKDGTVTTTPITIMKNGTKIYFEASAPVDDSGSTMTMFVIADSAAKTCDAYIPSARVTTNIPYSSVEELMDEYGDVSQTDTGDTYLGTVKATVSGKAYDVALYKNSTDNSVKKYYFDNGTPVRVEVQSSDGTVSITEYTITNSVDESKLKTPTGYIKADISGMTD